MPKKTVKKSRQLNKTAQETDRPVSEQADQRNQEIDLHVNTTAHPEASSPQIETPIKTAAIEETIKSQSEMDLETESAVVQDEKEQEFLAFVISGEEYGVDIMLIKEIIRPVAITYVPRVPDYVKGIISLRGTVVPIFDLAKRFGLNEQETGKRSRIVVVSFGTILVGFWADWVSEVVKLKESIIEPTPPMLREGAAECIRGVAHSKGRMIIIMDVERILNNLDLLFTRPTTNISSKANVTQKLG